MAVGRVVLDPFSEKERRRYLIDRLRAYLEALTELQVVKKVWLNGSFATFKPEPNDIDLLLMVDKAAVKTLTGSRALRFKALVVDRASVRKRFECDVYFTSQTDADDLLAWQKRFGRPFRGTSSKCIFTITLNANAPQRPN